MKPKRLFMPFLIILTIGLIGCQQVGKEELENNLTVEKAMENGKLALADGDYAKSKSNFQLALAEEEDNKEAKDWLVVAEEMELLVTYIENKEVEKAEESIADIKENDRYESVKSRIEEYESTLIALKSSMEKIDDEIASLNQKLEEGAYDEVIENGNTLKADENITETQLAVLNDMIEDAKAKQKQGEKEKQSEEPNQKEPSTSEQTGNFTYNTYTNSRFGFTVQYPTTFIQGPLPTNNDGRDFSNGEANILAYAGHINVLEDNEIIETYYNRALEAAPGSISYKQLGNDWYVISYKVGNDTVYEKAIIGESIISTVIITYPSSKQNYYEPMVTQIAKTFKGGQNELAW